MSPQLDGKFLTDDTSEAVEIVEKNGKVYLDYKTDYAKWEEELKSVSENQMTIVNPQKIEYQYKRATPINLLDGKEAK
ncbi:hypothetical protein H9W95_17795 [Flavobacterium lindanitolerans]|nr:hypothetical protein [Flavobacterium lindanitolerans]